MLCKYRDSLGKPNQGVHKHVAGIAIVDLLATILIAFGIAKWRKWNFFYVFGIIMVITIIVHRIFCVNTTINKAIFGKV